MNKLPQMLLASICLASSVAACADSPLLVRLRGIGVIPEASSTPITLIGGQVSHISNEIVPELDFSYFFNAYFATELILATTRHSAEATHTALGTVKLGSVWVLPPTLTLQYHFLPSGVLNPYLGAGLNYTHFYNPSNGPLSLSTHYGDSVGPAFQLGADLALNENWSLNVDVKQLFMKSHVQINTMLGQLSTQVSINPLVIGLGLGYRFS